jgi:hypothetical protein
LTILENDVMGRKRMDVTERQKDGDSGSTHISNARNTDRENLYANLITDWK